MKITLETSGGLAYIPGLARTAEVDTSTCQPASAQRLESLVRGVQFFDLPARTSAAPGAADYQTYTLTVRDGAKTHTVSVVDPVSHPGLQALIDEVARTTA